MARKRKPVHSDAAKSQHWEIYFTFNVQAPNSTEKLKPCFWGYRGDCTVQKKPRKSSSQKHKKNNGGPRHTLLIPALRRLRQELQANLLYTVTSRPARAT